MRGSAAGRSPRRRPRPASFRVQKIGRTAYWQAPHGAIASSPLGDASRGARTWPLQAAASTLGGPAPPSGALSRELFLTARVSTGRFRRTRGQSPHVLTVGAASGASVGSLFL